MGFATRSDLLARSNARRLAQLAVPTDVAMLPDHALRAAIEGGVLTGYTADEQAVIAQALHAIDTALTDADELVVSFGIPAIVRTPLLARLASTIALFYLQGGERMTEPVQKAYDAAVETFRQHANGKLNLLPPLPTDPVLVDGGAEIASSPGRYVASAGSTGNGW
ncbi:MAG: hypothetical protein A2496_22615 [Burkholderiales bacterium RIFOXYC12_FULL_60_6]|nr:MAG: hypothetical protein A2496_22615 [Burkholderiales bacterium RIFOXYC12_FULL_60_6]